MLTSRPDLRAYGLAVLALTIVAALSLGAVRAVEAGKEPPEPAAAGTLPRGGAIVLAGSGSNIPLTRALVNAFRRAHPDIEMRVGESIGSGGGLRALDEGTIDVALISRAPRADERSGREVIAYARTPVVFATRARGEVPTLGRERLLRIYRGEDERLVPVLREEGDSALGAILAGDPELGELLLEDARTQRFRVLYSDVDMERALIDLSRAIGTLDYGLIKIGGSDLLACKYEGRSHNDDGYPFQKTLSMVAAENPSEAMATWLQYMRSADARELIAASGYEALP